jgi:hypothetical protein
MHENYEKVVLDYEAKRKTQIASLI